MTIDEYDIKRQQLIDDGICHLCEGGGCPLCEGENMNEKRSGEDRRAGMNNVEVNETGTMKALSDTELRAERYLMALQEIIHMKSCLLADAQAIAKEAVEGDKSEVIDLLREALDVWTDGLEDESRYDEDRLALAEWKEKVREVLKS